jgi:peptidoglycan/LPS O-acetylase OafA/YrhL
LEPLLKNTGRNNNIAVLDGVRAFACLAVIAYHINRYTSLTHVWTSAIGSITTSIALTGWSGVTLFFVLSGFLLFMPYAKSMLFDSPWPSLRTFYFRRALRILPGYYASLFLLIILAHPQYLQLDHLKDLGLFLTLFMDSTHETYQQINGPFWTLAVEWQFYLLLPFLAWGFARVVRRGPLRLRVWKLALCLLGLVIWGVATRYWGHYHMLHPDQAPLLPRPIFDVAMFFLYGQDGKFLEDFAIGMFVCIGYTLSQHAKIRQRVSAYLRRYSLWFWGAGVFLLFFMATWSVYPPLQILAPLIGPHNWLTELGFALGFGLCVSGILFGPITLKRPFEWAPLRRTGIISYSLYIWHLPILLAFIAYVLPLISDWKRLFVYSLYWLCVALVIFPFCYLFYRCIEEPWIAFKNVFKQAR